MGTTLANLQIRTEDEIDLPGLPPDTKVCRLAEGWLTVLSAQFEPGNLTRRAKKLSAVIERPVLSVEYFDDDLMILNVFRGGKPAATHVSGNEYGMTKKTGKAKDFVGALELDASVADLLKYALQCEDLQKKVGLLEGILGCPLFIDAVTLREMGEESFRRVQDLQPAIEYAASKKAEGKIKNQTKAVLLEERDFLLDSCSTDQILVLTDPAEPGRRCSLNKTLYTFDQSDKLVPILSVGTVLDAPDMLMSNSDLSKIFIYCRFESQIRIYNIPLGTMTEVKIPKNTSPFFVLPDDSLLCVTHSLHSVLLKITADGSIAWELEIEYIHSISLHNGSIYLLYEIQNRLSELVRINLDGAIKSRVDFQPDGGRHWNYFLFDTKGYLYFCSRVEDVTNLFCFDRDLKEIRRTTFGLTSFDGLLDEEHRRVYVNLFDKCITAVDMDTFVAAANLNYDENLPLLCCDPAGRLVAKKGDSTLEVYDTDLTLVSKHKLKGRIIVHHINEAGNLCVVTSSNTKQECKTRIYELIS